MIVLLFSGEGHRRRRKPTNELSWPWVCTHWWPWHGIACFSRVSLPELLPDNSRDGRDILFCGHRPGSGRWQQPTLVQHRRSVTKRQSANPSGWETVSQSQWLGDIQPISISESSRHNVNHFTQFQSLRYRAHIQSAELTTFSPSFTASPFTGFLFDA